MNTFARYFLTAVILIFLFPSVIYAVSPSATNAAPWKVQKIEKLQEIKEERERIREEVKEIRREATEAAKLNREELRSRLAEIKDARKRLTVQRIDVNLEVINSRWIDHWNRVLERLSELLVKIGTRADKFEAAGVDVTDVREAIANANVAITEAQEAVNQQAGNTYVIEIEDEESLGENVSTTIHQLRDDFEVVRDSVKAAHDAVRDAVVLLKGANSVDSETEVEAE